MSQSGKLLLIDGNNILHSSYHAMPKLTNKDMVPTGGALGFCNVVMSLTEAGQYDYLAVCMDPERNFRYDLLDNYKGDRDHSDDTLGPQFGIVAEGCKAFKWPYVQKLGYEADDVIATLALAGKQQGLDVTVVSNDKDFIPLMNHGVSLYQTIKKQVRTTESVEAKYGVGPTQFFDWLCMIGDSGDSVPGINGVGGKKASQLLEQFGSLTMALHRLHEVEQPSLRSALASHIGSHRVTRSLIQFCTTVPVNTDMERYKYVPNSHRDSEAVRKFLVEYTFDNLAKRVGSFESSNRKKPTANLPTYKYKPLV